MFKCDKCGKITRPREKQTKKVVKTRDKTYTYTDKFDRNQIKFKENAEIVKEISLCEDCAKREENYE